VPNARVLTADAGVRARDRLAELLSPADVEAAATAAEAASVVVEAGAPVAASLAAALRGAGAFASATNGRLLASGTRTSFAIATARVDGAARALGEELLRAFDADRNPPRRLRLRDRTLDLAQRAKVMGILNVTPDSFFDRGAYSGVDRARARAAEMVELGADLIDIGGQSYAHWNPRIAAEEERARVVPVVEALVRDGLGVPLSIDTFKADVAEAALAAGAHLINDCSGLSDARLAGVVARHDAGLVVMHLKGELNVRASEYRYADALGEISAFLRERLDAALAAGVAADSLVIDPGLEFGKEPETDLEILERFGDLRSLGYPILFAASRKSFIGRVFNRPARELLVPSLATAAIGIAAGARLVRVHDVAETVALARMLAVVNRDNRRTASFAPTMPRDPAPAEVN
jgi:dihydropteroate synthase